MNTEEWFETWFDSPLYEKLYAYRDETEAARLIAWIAENFPPQEFPDALDMGCGRGRHSVLLAGQGYRVTGVDLSRKAITKARQKILDAGLSNLFFQTGDMLTFRSGPFDLVCNLFTSFGYFDDDADNISAIRNMISNLRHGGFLVMDYLNPGYIQNNLIREEKKKVGELTCEITRKVEGDMVIKTITFRDQPGTSDQFFQERVKLYNREWFEEQFKNLGVKEYRFMGDYDGSPYDADASERMLMTAKRPV